MIDHYWAEIDRGRLRRLRLEGWRRQTSWVRLTVLAVAVFTLTGAAPGPPPYRRADWGGWQGTCPDTRTQVLMRDARLERATPEAALSGPLVATPPAYLFRDGGCVLAWVRVEDPYTGTILHDPARIEIDHVLALKEAHEAGGWRWPPAKKNEFYNWGYNHLAVEGSVNAAKGSRPPPAWQPRPEFLCRYLERRSAARAAWRLAPPEETEAKFMRGALAGCATVGSER